MRRMGITTVRAMVRHRWRHSRYVGLTAVQLEHDSGQRLCRSRAPAPGWRGGSGGAGEAERRSDEVVQTSEIDRTLRQEYLLPPVASDLRSGERGAAAGRSVHSRFDVSPFLSVSLLFDCLFRPECLSVTGLRFAVGIYSSTHDLCRFCTYVRVLTSY